MATDKNFTIKNGLTVGSTEIISSSGNVDGRDVSADGAKLDTINTNADVTPSWVPSSDPSYLTGYTVTESDVTDHEAALSIATSQLTGDIDLTTQVTGTLPVSNMAATALTTVQTAASESAQLALTAQEGDVVVRSDENKTYMHNGGTAGTMADFTLLATPTDSVTSVDGNTGAVTTLQLGTTSTTALAGNTSLFSGSYADLTNKPTLLTLGTTSTTALAGDTSIPSGLTDLSISDGTNGQVLTTDGSGSFTFEDAASPYGDTEVSAHLNTSTANSDDVLSWNGSDFEWVEKGATFNTFTYVATSNQTTFSGSDSNSQTLAYSAGKVIVALNGTILKETTDYTATNGTSVVLATGAEASHELTIMAFGTFDVANIDYADVSNTPTLPTDFVSAANGGTFSGNVSVTGDLTVDTDTLHVDSTNNRVGIGTTSPTQVFEVNNGSNTAAAIKVTDTSGYTELFFGDSADDDAGYISYRHATNHMALGVNAAERMRIDSSGNVGIGDSSPLNASGYTTLSLNDTTGSLLDFRVNDGDAFRIQAQSGSSQLINIYNQPMSFHTNDSERMRIDSSGSVLVGKTNTLLADTGHNFSSSGFSFHTRSGGAVAYFNRTTSDGNIVEFYKDGTTVGHISTYGDGVVFGNAFSSAYANLRYTNNEVFPCRTTGGANDNAIDLGKSSSRFDDVYATNGTIQTSDANEKQQIASLTDAEITAAKEISKLFKTFKWNDSVAENGDNARTHTGVIAQDVQQAIADAGLDAGDYAFFISNTWWETQTEVPAVEADQENGVEAADAYTRTDTYDTAEEAPEGATERTRLGIRYPELLAFVSAATEQRLSNIESRLETLENNNE